MELVPLTTFAKQTRRIGGPVDRSAPEPPVNNTCSTAEAPSRFRLFAEALGTGSSSWHSEDGGPNSRRGGETPSSCATPTSASFPSEPEVDADVGGNPDGNNPVAPYPCQFCDRTFPRLSYLKKHEQVRVTTDVFAISQIYRIFVYTNKKYTFRD